MKIPVFGMWFCLLAVVCFVNGDKWEVMERSDCYYSCQSKCEKVKYKSFECIKQGGIFPKYAECHCWGYTYQLD